MAANERVRRLLRTTTFGLTLLQIAAFVLSASVAGAVLIHQFNEMMTAQIVDAIGTEVKGLSSIERIAGLAGVEAAIKDRTQSGASQLYILLGHDGAKLAGNLNRWPPELEPPSRGGTFRYIIERDGQSHERLAVGVPVFFVGGARAVAGRDIEVQRSAGERVKSLVLVALAFLVLAGLAIGAVGSRYVLSRIATVSETAETIMTGDLTRRIPRSRSGDEIDELAGRLNTMLDRIEQLMSGMREISDNIAHDLKTPLNRLRNRAEAALLDPRGPDAYREGIERTIEAADEIIATFNALLLIARLEAGALEETTEPFDLSANVSDLVELYAPSSEEAGLKLELDAPHPAPLSGNRQLIGQAAANLLDNAIKYGRPVDGVPATVELRVRTAGENVILEVGDHGPGIPPQDRDRVLKRFVRLEESRTQPGTGLGLSLVAAVARLHGGRIVLADNNPGLLVRMVLPRDRPLSDRGPNRV